MPSMPWRKPSITIIEGEGMKVDLKAEIGPLLGGPKETLKAVLIFLLDNSAPGSRELARQCGRLANRIADANGKVDLVDAEITLLKTTLDSDKGMKTWALEALEYHLWPKELADSDRERLSKRFNGKDG